MLLGFLIISFASGLRLNLTNAVSISDCGTCAITNASGELYLSDANAVLYKTCSNNAAGAGCSGITKCYQVRGRERGREREGNDRPWSAPPTGERGLLAPPPCHVGAPAHAARPLPASPSPPLPSAPSPPKPAVLLPGHHRDGHAGGGCPGVLLHLRLAHRSADGLAGARRPPARPALPPQLPPRCRPPFGPCGRWPRPPAHARWPASCVSTWPRETLSNPHSPIIKQKT